MSAEDPTVEEHLKMAHARARKTFDQARDLWVADFYAPSLVWAVRAAQVLMRDFVLAPHFMLEVTSWARSLRLGSKVLGSNDWKAERVTQILNCDQKVHAMQRCGLPAVRQ